MTQLDDAGVAARDVAESIVGLLEKLVHHILLTYDGERLPPGVQVASLGQGDDLVGPAPQLLGLG